MSVVVGRRCRSAASRGITLQPPRNLAWPWVRFNVGALGLALRNSHHPTVKEPLTIEVGPAAAKWKSAVNKERKPRVTPNRV